MRWRLGLGVLYLTLLLASHAVRRLAPLAPAAGPALEVGAVAVEADGTVVVDPGRPVRVAYRQWQPTAVAAGGGPPVAVLIHGSPGSARDFAGLGPLLAAAGLRVIAPDLPGFGASSRRLPDYSIRAHARYLRMFLDRLQVPRAHLIGFSMGGGVALHMAAPAPERVASVTLLSAIGVQELELLGAYHANHALHGIQLGGLLLLQELVPHFGVFDNWMLSVPYARNFYDSDQRPLRGILRRFTAPMLILHGERDVLVPYAAAREHHRLVPHSELVTLDANHFLVFLAPERLAPPILDFVARVEAGTALRRTDAEPARLAAAAAPAGEVPPVHGLALIVTTLLLAAATMASEDLTCITAGLLVAQGRLAFPVAAFACFLGIFVGDLLLYLAGRWLGRPWLGRVPLRFLVRPEEVARSARWFARRGTLVIFLSRFLPGTRLPTYLTAGVLRMPFLRYALSLLVPVALWTPLLVGTAYLLGERMLDSFAAFSRYAAVGMAGFIATVWLMIALARALATYRGRRRLLGWWRRQTRWEFWPRWRFYPPVVLYVLWLGLRYRAPTLFTAANPAMPAGGVIGESKSDILRRLDPASVARFAFVPGALSAAKKKARVAAFIAEHRLTLPVVLKPDVGQRGDGVAVAADEAAIGAFFAATPGDAIVQEYVAGPELGVFYVRLPGARCGRIFSLTDKQLPAVIGDGSSTLERLVLDDPRAVAMAAVYLRQLGARRDRVPAAGEPVRLVELGTHCRGAVFLDGERFRTPQLERAVDQLSRGVEGFYFGRYDLRAATEDDLRAGRFKVLELNGVTSEATHIYDPRYRLRDAYRVLFEQWRLAFAVGAANRARGVRPASLGELARLLRGAGAARRHPAGRPA